MKTNLHIYFLRIFKPCENGSQPVGNDKANWSAESARWADSLFDYFIQPYMTLLLGEGQKAPREEMATMIRFELRSFFDVLFLKVETVDKLTITCDAVNILANHFRMILADDILLYPLDKTLFLEMLTKKLLDACHQRSRLTSTDVASDILNKLLAQQLFLYLVDHFSDPENLRNYLYSTWPPQEKIEQPSPKKRKNYASTNRSAWKNGEFKGHS